MPENLPGNKASGAAAAMHDNYSYRAWQEIHQPLKMNNKLLAGLVERLTLSEPTEHRGRPTNARLLGKEIAGF